MNYPDIVPSVRSILHAMMNMMSSSSTDNSSDGQHESYKGSNNHQTMLGGGGLASGGWLLYELMIGFVNSRWNVNKIVADYEYTCTKFSQDTINYWSPTTLVL